MQLLSYFGALPPAVRNLPGGIEGYERLAWQKSLLSLLCRPPLCVPLGALRICFPPSSARHNAAVADADLLQLLNGRLVGLLRLPSAQASHARDGRRALPLPLCGCECEGLAIVRSVDVAKGTLYLLTPLALERVVGVNALALSALELPTSVLLPTAFTAPSPYLTAQAVRGAGAAAMHSRNNIVRGGDARAAD